MERIKRGLVLEGGGMRSSYLSGVLQAFHDRRLTDFDVVVGSSAGAACGANFIAGEPEKNRTILEDHLTGRNFVKFRNLFSRENILDIDFLIDDLCNGLVPLNIPKIRSAGATLYISAFHAQTGETVYFNSREHDLFTALRASCAMPYLYRKRVFHEGVRYFDGGLPAAVPVEKAVEEGCREIIVVGTRESGYCKSKDRLPLWMHRLFYRDCPALGPAFQIRHQRYNDTLTLIQSPPAGVSIIYMAPKGKLPVSRTTRNRDRVKAAVKMGYEEGLEFYQNYARTERVA